ncbi:MAG: hypothetical protein ACREAS_10130 [Nitrososphaera sp.]
MTAASSIPPNDDSKKPKYSKKAKIIIFILVVLFIITPILFVWWYMDNLEKSQAITQRAFDAGCQPETFSRRGIPVWWTCPPGVVVEGLNHNNKEG